jgi:hypothetical protein
LDAKTAEANVGNAVKIPRAKDSALLSGFANRHECKARIAADAERGESVNEPRRGRWSVVRALPIDGADGFAATWFRP